MARLSELRPATSVTQPVATAEPKVDVDREDFELELLQMGRQLTKLKNQVQRLEREISSVRDMLLGAGMRAN